MAYTSKLNFPKGGTIAGNGALRPGQQIKKAIEEIQSKSVTDLTSKAPGLEFERRGKNTWALVSKSASGGQQLIRVADPVRNDGTSGSLEIKYENGQYVVYVTFPRVNRTVINGKEPEEVVNGLEERVAALEEALAEATLALNLVLGDGELKITGGLTWGGEGPATVENDGEGIEVTDCTTPF